MEFDQPMQQQVIEKTESSFVAELAILLVGLWFMLTCVAFWWFESRQLQPFMTGENVKAVFFDGEQLMHKLGNAYVATNAAGQQHGLATVVHFWDPDCPCNSKNESHLNRIIDTYGNQGVQFIVVTPNTNTLDEARDRFSHPAVIRYLAADQAGVAPPSSPAAVVINNTGATNYFGPYSVGAQCLSENGAFVEQILDSLLVGKNRTQVNTAAIGCFCDWHSKV